jgi:hypothetical protein
MPIVASLVTFPRSGVLASMEGGYVSTPIGLFNLRAIFGDKAPAGIEFGASATHYDVVRARRRAWSCMPLIRGILAALRQKFHLSACPKFGRPFLSSRVYILKDKLLAIIFSVFEEAVVD